MHILLLHSQDGETENLSLFEEIKRRISASLCRTEQELTTLKIEVKLSWAELNNNSWTKWYFFEIKKSNTAEMYIWFYLSIYLSIIEWSFEEDSAVVSELKDEDDRSEIKRIAFRRNNIMFLFSHIVSKYPKNIDLLF